MADRLPNKFPLGLRVLLVGRDSPTRFKLLDILQYKCKYEVTVCTRPEEASALLQKNMAYFDVVLSQHMDGIELLASIRSMEMMNHHETSVVLFSDDQEMDVDVLKQAFEKGACDFLLKPIPDQALKMIWKHPFRSMLGKEASVLEVNQQERSVPVHQSSSDAAATNQSEGSSGRRMDLGIADQQEDEGNCSKGNEPAKATAIMKKRRAVWGADLHRKFVQAINNIIIRKNPSGYDGSAELDVIPKDIFKEMQEMGVPAGLTRVHIASHLQKYREYMKEQRKMSRDGHPCQINYSSTGQYGFQPGQSNPPAPSAPNHGDICSQNFAMGHAPNIHSPFGQQLGPLNIARMTQQQNVIGNSSPVTYDHHLIGNSNPHRVVRSADPLNLQLRPSAFFPATDHQQYIRSSGPNDHGIGSASQANQQFRFPSQNFAMGHHTLNNYSPVDQQLGPLSPARMPQQKLKHHHFGNSSPRHAIGSAGPENQQFGTTCPFPVTDDRHFHGNWSTYGAVRSTDPVNLHLRPSSVFPTADKQQRIRNSGPHDHGIGSASLANQQFRPLSASSTTEHHQHNAAPMSPNKSCILKNSAANLMMIDSASKARVRSRSY